MAASAVANVKWPPRQVDRLSCLAQLADHSLLVFDRIAQPDYGFLEWMWTYFARGRGVRLITGEPCDQKAFSGN
jgi:hypothetical protein